MLHVALKKYYLRTISFPFFILLILAYFFNNIPSGWSIHENSFYIYFYVAIVLILESFILFARRQKEWYLRMSAIDIWVLLYVIYITLRVIGDDFCFWDNQDCIHLFIALVIYFNTRRIRNSYVYFSFFFVYY